MLNPNETDVDVQRLMHEIRASVARRHDDEEPNTAPPGPTEVQLAEKNHYHVNDLLRFHGDEFVRSAYRTILGREPDEAGMAHHLEELASGRFNKIDVLASLRSSPEGRNAQVQLDGLSLPVAVRRLGRVPFIGYFIRLAVGILRLPNSIQHQNRFEFYAWSQQRSLKDRQDQQHKQLSESLQQIAAQILEIMQSATEQQRANELAFAQQAILEEHLGEARRSFDESTSNLSSQLALVIDKIAALTEEPASVTQELALVRQELTAVRQDLAATQNAFSQDRLKTGEAADQLQTLRLARERIETELLMQERRLTVLLEALARNMPAIHDRDVAAVVATEEQHLLDPLYAAFEDEFRGPRDEILQRLQVYVPFLHNAEIRSDVLDLGCGRGEWLELLKSESIDARGVDRNRVFIEACRRADLNVIQDDALVYLRSLAGESLNLVTAFHLVEHLPFEMLIKLLDEIARTLRHGGMLILETPNPENFMVGSCTFYADPTHRNPIPTKTLQFLVESRGFKTIEVLKLRSWIEAQIKDESELAKRFNEYFYSAPDYAVIAGKP